MSFEEYLKSGWGREYILEHKTNMIEHITDDCGNIIVDKVCRFEDLNNELKQVCEKLGIYEPATLSHIGERERSSEDRDYRSWYSPETRQMIAERFSEIINRYGYEF
jgi:hypothetical protein